MRTLVCVLLGWVIACGQPITCRADGLQGRVVRVVDTLVLLVSTPDGQKRQEKIRLAGVDSPESGQPWGQRAKQALSGYAFGHD